MSAKPTLGVLLGDSTGMGLEIVTKITVSGFLNKYCRPIIIGDNRIFENTLRMVNVAAPHCTISEISEADWNEGIPVLDQKDRDPAEIEIGKINADCGKTVSRMIQLTCRLCQDGTIEGFSFAPFNKSAMIEGGCTFEGEHHLMADIFGVTGPFDEINVLGGLMTIHMASHIPVSTASENLSMEWVLRAILLSYQAVKSTGTEHPVLGIVTLNPHCGENGRCSQGELDIIGPTVEKAHEMGMDVQSPFSANVLFIKTFRGDFHSAVTIYHDQGQITLKLKDFDQGITIAGNQPYPIVTCAHGIAYDIIGKGVVHISIFENAVKMATKMAVHKRTDS